MSELWNDFIQDLSIQQQTQPLLGNAIYLLTQQSFLQVQGPDAAKFLQGQLSCDINQLSLKQSGLGTHSSPKGRMLSSFRICQTEDEKYLLRLHQSILDKADKALAKYIVFSKASLEQEKNLVGIGLHGETAFQNLQDIFSDTPQSDYSQHVEQDCILICTSARLKSYELYMTIEKAIALWPALSHGLEITNEQQQILVQQQLGLAFVEENTFDAFIPQMFNYQVTSAVSFKKGCYTGQEIVARMQYLGKLKRHCYHYQLQSEGHLNIGDEIYLKDGTQAIGNILSAVRISEHEWQGLFVLTKAAADAGKLKTMNTTLSNLQKKELPYNFDESV